MTNRLCKTLGIEYPVIQGAMAWTSMAPLAAAVSEAGGLGVLGSGFMPREVVLGQAAAVRALTQKPFAANLFLHPDPLSMAGADAILEAGIPIVYIDSPHQSALPLLEAYCERFHQACRRVIVKTDCIENALAAAEAGADVIIAKGMEGGGHCARVSARVLLAEVTEALSSVPIVASGGIARPRQAAACTLMGAEGVEMGTAFVATNECPVHPNVKQAIVNAADTGIVTCCASTGEPRWQIRNGLASRLMAIEAAYPRAEAASRVREEIEGALRIACLDGEVEENGAVMAGQAAGLIHGVRPARELVVDFCREWQSWLERPCRMF